MSAAARSAGPAPAAPWASFRDAHPGLPAMALARSHRDARTLFTTCSLGWRERPAAAAAGASASAVMLAGQCFGFARAGWFGRIASGARRGVVRANAHLEQQLLVAIDHQLLRSEEHTSELQ